MERHLKMAMNKSQRRIFYVVLVVLLVLLVLAIPIYFNLGPVAHSATL